MTELYDNFVKEESNSTGTGNLTLSSVTGFRRFSTAFGTGGTDVFLYAIRHQSANEWEFGTGHLSDSTTLVRDTVIDSSNADSLVSFSAGDKDVVCDTPESKQGLGDPLRTITATSQATVDFANGNIDSTYNTYMFILAGVRPATDQQGLILRLSNDGGTNWIAGSSYDYTVFVHNSGGTASRGGDGNSSIYLTDNTAGRPGSAAGEGVTAFLSLDSPSDTGSYTRVNGNSNYDRNDNTTEGSLVDGRYDTAEAINGVRFLFNSGNIATGIFELYGVG